MGTWGAHPFASDGAQDLIDFLAKRSDAERREALHEIFEAAPHAGQDHVDVFPDDVVAAALLIALSVPGGSQRLGEHDAEEARNSLVADLDTALAAEALGALETVRVPGNDWYDTWIEDGEDGEAAQVAQAIVDILDDFTGAGSSEPTTREPRGMSR